jgi:hypothetical protein
MLDFPSSPSHGDRFDKFMWDASVAPGAWLKVGVALPPYDGCEYIRVGGVWRKKTERKDVSGVASTNYSFNAPTGAKRARWCGCAWNTSTTAVQMFMRVDDGTSILSGATNYRMAGWYHATGSSGYTNQAATSLAQFNLTVTLNQTNVPLMFEGWLMVDRVSSTRIFPGMSNGVGYNSASTTLSQIFNSRLDVESAATTSLTLARLIFYGSVGTTSFQSGSFIEVEWFY